MTSNIGPGATIVGSDKEKRTKILFTINIPDGFSHDQLDMDHYRSIEVLYRLAISKRIHSDLVWKMKKKKFLQWSLLYSTL